MEERRQLPRWEIKKEVKVWLPGELGFSHCIIEDMHLKGMCVSFNKPLPLQQDPLRLSFLIEEGSSPIKIEAQIPWAKEVQDRFVYGLSFNKIDDHDKSRIYQYIDTNCYDQFKKKWWGKGIGVS